MNAKRAFQQAKIKRAATTDAPAATQPPAADLASSDVLKQIMKRVDELERETEDQARRIATLEAVADRLGRTQQPWLKPLHVKPPKVV